MIYAKSCHGKAGIHGSNRDKRRPGAGRGKTMIPISDDNTTRVTPFVTWSLVFACVAVYLWQLQQGGDA